MPNALKTSSCGLVGGRVGHHAYQILHADGRYHHVEPPFTLLVGEISQQAVGKIVATGGKVGLGRLTQLDADRLYASRVFTTAVRERCYGHA